MRSGKRRIALFIALFSAALSWEQPRLNGQTVLSPISISPSVATISTADTIDLKADYTDAHPLNWLVNGVSGGNAKVGSLVFPNDPDRHTAQYHPPAVIDTTSSVTVTVWANDGISAGSATIVITRPACGDHCTKISLADNPASKLTSYPMRPGDTVRFTARNPENEVIPAKWKVTPAGRSAINPSCAGKSNVLECFLPLGPRKLADVNAPTVLLKATPTDPSYPSANLNLILAPQVLIRCNQKDAALRGPCKITDFDRFKNTPDSADAGIISAINASKSIFSGSIISARITSQPSASNCTNYDWKIAVQSKEATGILIYNPADVGSGICKDNRFIVALPVHVLWADVFGYEQVLDPTRGAPAQPAAFMDCAGQLAPPTIVPCDKDTSRLLAGFYGVGRIANHFVPPGNGAGSINFSGKGQVSFDIQADPAIYVGRGWINFPLVFERGTTNANLNSLVFGMAYDFRWIQKPNFGDGPLARSPFILRRPQLQIWSGPEFSPSHPAAGSAPAQTRDWNYVWGETIRLPLVFNFHQQPSSISIYPLLGGEQGWHLTSNLSQNNPILRGVTGIDGSFRWPYNLTHNFLGPNPIQFEGQYRIRGLLYREPFTDFNNLPPSGTVLSCPHDVSSMPPYLNPGCMVLSSSRRQYYKGKVTIPLDPYIQLSFTVYGGALPPVFWNVPHSITLGLTFGNPGSVEH